MFYGTTRAGLVSDTRILLGIFSNLKKSTTHTRKTSFGQARSCSSALQVTYLCRRVVRHHEPGSFDDGHVGEAELVGGLDQTHAVFPHVQEHFLDVHRWWVPPPVHLQDREWLVWRADGKANAKRVPRGADGLREKKTKMLWVWVEARNSRHLHHFLLENYKQTKHLQTAVVSAFKCTNVSQLLPLDPSLSVITTSHFTLLPQLDSLE